MPDWTIYRLLNWPQTIAFGDYRFNRSDVSTGILKYFRLDVIILFNSVLYDFAHKGIPFKGQIGIMDVLLSLIGKQDAIMQAFRMDG